MNENLQAFVASMGVLCEIWTLTHKNFVAQGMNEKDAMTHTQGFMTTFMNTVVNHDGKNDKK